MSVPLLNVCDYNVIKHKHLHHYSGKPQLPTGYDLHLEMVHHLLHIEYLVLHLFQCALRLGLL